MKKGRPADIEILQISIAGPDEFRIIPWKNGLGRTRELLLKEINGSDKFAWRLSVAPVSSDGEFSDFSGYARTLVLIQGNGLTLRHDNGQVDQLTKRLDFACFDGGWKTWAELTDGDITDFNVMAAQEYCQARVAVFEGSKENTLSVNADELLIYPLDHAIKISPANSDQLNIQSDHVARIELPEQGVWRFSGSPSIWVQIHYNNR